jgi:uncharacterized SAM-binding protein YcdF (DUF218 family)
MSYIRMAIRIVLALGLVALVAAGCDFANFVGRADRAIAPEPPEAADGVTALTGASDARIKAGVDLATQLQLPLLISGVHVDTSTADIAAITSVPETEIQCCVTLGRAAATTEGNGAEVAEWARRHKMTRIIVVTSEYHMDRALLELRRAMPEGEFVPYAVASGQARPRDWFRDPTVARRMFEEWAKFRVASLRAGPATAEPSQEPSEAG